MRASLFIVGWRPAIGWACAGAIILYYWPNFIIGQGLWVLASVQAGSPTPHPDLGIGDIVGLLTPMLGISTLRTIEKLQGVARSNLDRDN